jgi:hypothetical protein
MSSASYKSGMERKARCCAATRFSAESSHQIQKVLAVATRSRIFSRQLILTRNVGYFKPLSILAQASATLLLGASMPGNVAQPPFSMNGLFSTNRSPSVRPMSHDHKDDETSPDCAAIGYDGR